MKWIESTESAPWVEKDAGTVGEASTSTAAIKGIALTGERQQAIRGFGGCFNELGYVALTALPEAEQQSIVRELFSPDELNFNTNRTPVGANDFATGWYSYDETPGDIELRDFSIARDEQAVIPYIRRAQAYQPDMELFASPWSPPTWMKSPPVYNYGTIVETPENLAAYARYFEKYIRAYAERGIHINQLHVQNEVFADQKFPSCRWTSEQLRVFIRDYLGPHFDAAGLDTAIWLGTLNGPEDMAWTAEPGMNLTNYHRYVDNILFDDEARKYIAGIGYQWAGQQAIARTHESWPELEIMQTESECGMGKNSWDYAEYVFHLVQHYFRHGATAYVYWNMILEPGGFSSWGWPQDSLFTVDTATGEVTRNPEYYVIKHYSSVVHRGAVRLGVEGRFSPQATVFENPGGGRVVVVQNALDRAEEFAYTDPSRPGENFVVTLSPRSFNTFVL